MNLDHPDRPRIGGGRPAWLTAPNIVVPSLLLTPNGPGMWQVQFMLPNKLSQTLAFSYVARNLESGAELEVFLLDWYDSPEDALMRYFAEEPPKGKVWTITREDPSAELETTKSLEELDL